jgi:hypothetical protein
MSDYVSFQPAWNIFQAAVIWPILKRQGLQCWKKFPAELPAPGYNRVTILPDKN